MILTAICLILIPVTEARDWGRSGANKPPYSLVGYYGVASYGMDDLNRSLEIWNEQSGYDYVDPIEGGTEFGVRLLVPINWNLSIGFNYTALMASTGYGPLPNDPYYLEIDTRGSSFEISLDARKELGEKFGLGGGVALSRFKSDGHYLGTDSGGYFEYEMRAAGWGPVIRVNGDMGLSRSIFLWLEGGYRHAETGTVEHNGYDWMTPDGKKMTFSYTGFFVRLGLRATSWMLN